MSNKRLDRIGIQREDNSGRIYDLYSDKIVLIARTPYFEARAKTDKGDDQMAEISMHGGPHLKVGDILEFPAGKKVKFTNFKLDKEHELSQYFDITVVEIEYEELFPSIITKVKDKLLSKLGIK